MITVSIIKKFLFLLVYTFLKLILKGLKFYVRLIFLVNLLREVPSLREPNIKFITVNILIVIYP